MNSIIICKIHISIYIYVLIFRPRVFTFPNDCVCRIHFVGGPIY
uniref:Uncharacterized protein n=1 Tax=Ciona intestinalis TaxID=7719 RepID=H2XZR8_CIOIN